MNGSPTLLRVCPTNSARGRWKTSGNRVAHTTAADDDDGMIGGARQRDGGDGARDPLASLAYSVVRPGNGSFSRLPRGNDGSQASNQTTTRPGRRATPTFTVTA